jgi:hypothetical protein
MFYLAHHRWMRVEGSTGWYRATWSRVEAGRRNAKVVNLLYVGAKLNSVE